MIGVFGGTFDPVHYGHIKPALSVRDALKLSQIRFIPNRLPPHRDTPWLTVDQRIELLQCALKDEAGAIVDLREIQRSGPSYMVDTLYSLQQEFRGETLVLIIGMDALYGISGWFQWKKIFEYSHLVVTTRPGYQQQMIAEHMNTQDYQYLADRITADVSVLSARVSGKILLQSVPQLDISSTRIRESLKNGTDISSWVPEDVHQLLMRINVDDH